MNPITLFLVIACALVGLALGKTVDFFLAPPFLVAAVIIALSLKMANAWQKFVVLRAGKLQGVKGPGLFLIFPIIDNVAAVIDERWLPTVAAATSIIGINRSSANGDQAARTRSAVPAIIRSNVLPLPSSAVVFVIAAVARLRIETITNFARMIATSNSTRRRAHRLVAGQIMATNVSGRKKTQM